jgi:hypothetical protein
MSRGKRHPGGRKTGDLHVGSRRRRGQALPRRGRCARNARDGSWACGGCGVGRKLPLHAARAGCQVLGMVGPRGVGLEWWGRGEHELGRVAG